MPSTKKNEGSPDRPDIFRYHNYRDFLQAWFDYQRTARSGFSLRAIAKKAQLSCAYLPLVLSGARNLSAKALEKLSPHLGLTSQERSFLDLLRILSDSDSQMVRQEAFNKIQKSRSYRQLNPKEIEVYRYLDRWYYVAVREMVSLPDFKPDPQWIQARLGDKVTLGQAREALEFLTTHGFIAVQENGKATLIEKDLDCVSGVFRMALGNFHKQMLAVSSQVLDINRSNELRNIMGYTMAFPAIRFDEIKAIINDAINQIEKLGKEVSAPDAVYHMTFLGVPLTIGMKEGPDDEKNAN